MLQKVLCILCSSALVSAGVIGTDYSPATLVSFSSVSTPVVTKTISTPIVEKNITEPVGYTKIIKSSPIYESVLTTQESNFKTPDGSQHTAYSKSVDTSYSSIKKYESKEDTKDSGVTANSITDVFSTGVNSPIIYHHPETAYTISSPLFHSISSPAVTKSNSVPVTYSRHSIPLTETVSSPITSYTTPVLGETVFVSSGLSPYSSYTPLSDAQTHTQSESSPVAYTTHGVPLSQRVSAPITSYTPVVAKTKVVSSGLSSVSSHTPVIEAQPFKTTFTYSESPIVSRMTFSGLGTSYSW